MFYLFTGLPGSKKTANMIHFVTTDSQFKGRPVFYHRIKECKVPDWRELTENEVKDWPNVLPSGAVLLIDECQKLWRPASWDKVPPAHVTELEEHRHRGIDIVATTQHPMLVHTAVRRQVQQHRHYSAEYGLRSKALVWEKCVNDPDDHFNKQDADRISGEVPKTVFTLYKSTELNTHKKRPPKKLFLFLLSILFVCLIGLYLYNRVSSDSGDGVQVSDAAAVVDDVSAVADEVSGFKPVSDSDSSFKPVYPIDKSEYLALYRPRIEGMPHTAPIYDHLQEPVVSPRTFCVRKYFSSGGSMCQCFTQQATLIDVSMSMCDSYIDFGVFDPTLQPVRQASYSGQGEVVKPVR